MAKAVRKKKTPITSSQAASASTSSHGPTGSSTKPSAGTSALATRTLIRKFHVLLKRQAQLKHKLTVASAADSPASDPKGKGKATAREPANVVELEDQLREVETEMTDLGGLDWYQRASTLGQAKERGGDSSHVLVSWLKELGRHKEHSKANPLRVLEIGALLPTNFAPHPWIHNTPIDLHSRHPLITEQDFMDRPVPAAMPADPLFDVVSCSLVLNFVPEARDRGRMLLHTLSFLPPPAISTPTTPAPLPSYLFLVLPTPCILNSRFLTPPHLQGLMLSLGYNQVRSRWKGEKGVAYWLYERVEPVPGDGGEGEGGWGKKRVLRGKGGCNNFAVALE